MDMLLNSFFGPPKRGFSFPLEFFPPKAKQTVGVLDVLERLDGFFCPFRLCTPAFQ